MLVQELFQKVKDNIDEFVDYYLKYIDIDYKGDKNKIKSLVCDIINYNDIKVNEDNIIFFIPDYPIRDCIDCFDIFVIKREDLLNSENVVNYGNITPYSLEFTPIKEVLGYRVSQACLYTFKGLYRVLGYLLYEMTFFGYSINEQEDNSKDEINIINSEIDNIESGKANLISFDEMLDNLKVDKDSVIATPYEKVFDDTFINIENTFLNELTNNLYKLERGYIKDGKSKD